MRNIWAAFLCAGSNFRKWRKNPTIILLAVVWSLFLISYFIEVPAVSLQRGSNIIPWLMPFTLIHPLNRFLFCTVMIVLFAQAPFSDISTPFAMIRTGRLSWFLGQILYILGTSAVVTLFTFVCTVLVTVPCMDLRMDWGPRLYRIVLDVALRENEMAESIMTSYSVWEAMWHTAKLQFLTGTLIGSMILFFNMFRQGLGMLVTSAVAAWSLFAMYGRDSVRNYGRAIYRTAILQWSSLFSLHPMIEKEGVPMGDAVNTMVWLIAVFLIGSIILYYKRDAHFNRNQF